MLLEALRSVDASSNHNFTAVRAQQKEWASSYTNVEVYSGSYLCGLQGVFEVLIKSHLKKSVRPFAGALKSKPFAGA